MIKQIGIKGQVFFIEVLINVERMKEVENYHGLSQ